MKMINKGSNESIDRFDRIKVSFCMSINANKKNQTIKMGKLLIINITEYNRRK